MKNKHNKHRLSELLGTYGFCNRVTIKSDSNGAFKDDGDDITIMTLALRPQVFSQMTQPYLCIAYIC